MASVVRPFVARMPVPRIDEGLLGYMDRALQNTMIRNSRQALRMAGLDPDPNAPPNAAKLTEEAVAGLAALFKLDPEEVRRRWYRREHGSSAMIEFFGTPIRAQYWESRYRRLSPRALAGDPYYRALWEIRCFGFDPDTREPLVEVCPVCGRRFGWTSMRGPTKCDHCTDRDGYPSTDLRDHPQPIIEFRDPEAIGFVVALLHPDPQRRRAAMALVPQELAGATNGELFEAVMCMASALRPGASTKLTDAGRPLRAPDFTELSAEMLEAAGRALIGGEDGFAALAARMRVSADERTSSHGLYKELGPLAAMPLDRHLSPVIRRFANDAIARDLARTRDDGFVRRSVPRLADAQGGAWLTMDALSAELGLRKHALGRLAESGAVETRRADAEQSPVLMKIADVAPLAAVYKDAVTGRMVTALLRVPASAIEDLADRELIQRVQGPAAAMLPRKRYYRESSAKAVLIAIRERAAPAAGEGRVKLIAAVRELGGVAPWAAIVEGIVTGALQIRTEAPFGRDWRHAVSVDQSELEAFLKQAARPATAGAQEAWLTRDQAAQMLGTDETVVWAMGRDGILPKRKGEVAMFTRADVEAGAKRWIFGQEMSAHRIRKRARKERLVAIDRHHARIHAPRRLGFRLFAHAGRSGPRSAAAPARRSGTSGPRRRARFCGFEAAGGRGGAERPRRVLRRQAPRHRPQVDHKMGPAFREDRSDRARRQARSLCRRYHRHDRGRYGAQYARALEGFQRDSRPRCGVHQFFSLHRRNRVCA
ncbi:hypothetical protein ACVW1A_008291 [Bradyrhizobium sp. LB1.3]|uniref:hypothetical protein n=1 Tax=unclassified Bradyrhizobium TaxID=2631580 RepID=UPI00339A5C61